MMIIIGSRLDILGCQAASETVGAQVLCPTMDTSTYIFLVVSVNVLIWLVYTLHIGFNIRDLLDLFRAWRLNLTYVDPGQKGGDVAPVSFVGFYKPQWTPLTLRFHT
jgi:hypothetical protein